MYFSLTVKTKKTHSNVAFSKEKQLKTDKLALTKLKTNH